MEKIIITNKKASFDYFLFTKYEVGIALVGTEIKSIRNHSCNLKDSYVIIRNGEVFILNMNIAEYSHGNLFNHDPLRTRKLLMHKKEILKLNYHVHHKLIYYILPFPYLYILLAFDNYNSNHTLLS